MSFVLDARLETDSHFVIDMELSQVRLSNNAAFPWVILVPKRPDVVEIIDLDDGDQQLLWSEIAMASRIMKRLYQPKKLNVANIGNKVSQLHVHVVARYEDDQAWPGPIWNSGISESYDPQDLQEKLLTLQSAFNELFSGAGA
ncbi:MAG TPA: HIT family protein, partial [Alphaproteobacteria bacterium]